MKISLGYCCVSMLHEKLRCSRSSTKTYLDRHDKNDCHEYLVGKAKQNLNDLVSLLRENKKNEIVAYRIPEQILPQIDLGYYKVEELREELLEVGKVANAFDIQLSTHPSQYYVLNSLRKEVVDKTIHSLNLFADTLQQMELLKIPNIVLHVGMKNGYDTVEEALNSFCNNYGCLNQAAKQYLVVENDHVSFCVEDCLKIHKTIGIPVVFDNMHYRWNQGRLDYEEAVSLVVKTWDKRIPKFHLASDKGTNKHAHSDYILLSDYEKLVGAINKTGIKECNIMLECKEKDRAVLQLRKEIEESKFI